MLLFFVEIEFYSLLKKYTGNVPSNIKFSYILRFLTQKVLLGFQNTFSYFALI